MYRPNASKVKNLKTKDYLGKARLVAVESSQQAFTGFQGSTYKNVSHNNPLCSIKISKSGEG